MYIDLIIYIYAHKFFPPQEQWYAYMTVGVKTWANGSVKLVIVIVLLRLFSKDFQMNPYQKREFQKGLNIQY